MELNALVVVVALLVALVVLLRTRHTDARVCTDAEILAGVAAVEAKYDLARGFLPDRCLPRLPAPFEPWEAIVAASTAAAAALVVAMTSGEEAAAGQEFT